jgi:hypothetical protein
MAAYGAEYGGYGGGVGGRNEERWRGISVSIEENRLMTIQPEISGISSWRQ